MSVFHGEYDRLFCPILGERCIGKRCAMAVSRDHPLVSAYDIIWECGLTCADESNHRRAQAICVERDQR